ncbi:MAG: heparan-alpha-glucosaminide N-acetyltransferase domain-containing protein, partial [Actinomycetota bacterium]|nr:heparan-alpha-glucosaminide N-acetyltransferase domain-containing protein [Actinomycetota bacterium]
MELIEGRMGWGPRRVIGVDLARGLAMIGMFGAHLNVPREVTVADPSTYLALVHGRSAILFALLAGVSLAIVTGGPTPQTGRAVVDFRLKTLVRAIALFALGGLLSMLGTPVAVILEAYAAMFVLALLVMSWSAKRLWVAVG